MGDVDGVGEGGGMYSFTTITSLSMTTFPSSTLGSDMIGPRFPIGITSMVSAFSKNSGSSILEIDSVAFTLSGICLPDEVINFPFSYAIISSPESCRVNVEIGGSSSSVSRGLLNIPYLSNTVRNNPFMTEVAALMDNGTPSYDLLFSSVSGRGTEVTMHDRIDSTAKICRWRNFATMMLIGFPFNNHHRRELYNITKDKYVMVIRESKVKLIQPAIGCKCR